MIYEESKFLEKKGNFIFIFIFLFLFFFFLYWI